MKRFSLGKKKSHLILSQIMFFYIKYQDNNKQKSDHTDYTNHLNRQNIVMLKSPENSSVQHHAIKEITRDFDYDKEGQ